MNSRPLVPQTNALTKLRYIPFSWKFSKLNGNTAINLHGYSKNTTPSLKKIAFFFQSGHNTLHTSIFPVWRKVNAPCVPDASQHSNAKNGRHGKAGGRNLSFYPDETVDRSHRNLKLSENTDFMFKHPFFHGIQ